MDILSQVIVPLMLVCLVMMAAIGGLYWSMRRNNQSSARRESLGTPVSEIKKSATPRRQSNPLAGLEEDLPDLGMLMGSSSSSPFRELSPTPVKVKLNTGTSANARELITILRDESDGRLMVQIGTATYRTLSASPDAKREFTAIMKELGNVILTPDGNVSKSPPTAATPPAPTPSAIPSTEPPKPTPPAEPSQPAVTPPVDPTPPATFNPTPEPLPGDLPSYRLEDNPFKKEGGFFSAPPPDSGVPELNIAGAIEAYLQYKLERTPAYRDRNIHIRPALGGGVRVEVDDESYEMVDDVADPEVRAFIKSAIEEWQSRQ